MSPQQDETVPEEELEREAMEARPSADDGTGIDLCPSCLQGVPYPDTLCPHCGAPVCGTAGMAPWERTLAEGFIYRSAVANPRKRIVLTGVWLLFFPSLITGCVLAWMQSRSGFYGPVAFLLPIFQIVVSTAVLYQTTMNYYRRPMVN